MGSTAILGLAVPPVAGLLADTAGLQTGYPGGLAPQGRPSYIPYLQSVTNMTGDFQSPCHRYTDLQL